MQLTGKITPETLMSLEAYTKWRKLHKPEVIAHRKLRSVQLGDHINVQFESETTIRYQIQEMLRIEKIFEEEGIQDEIEAYAPLVPDGTIWKATMLLEYPDISERRRLETEIRESESYLTSAMESSVAAIAIFDAE